MTSEQRPGRNQGESHSNTWGKSPTGNGNRKAARQEGVETVETPPERSWAQICRISQAKGRFGVFSCASRILMWSMAHLLPNISHLLSVPSPDLSRFNKTKQNQPEEHVFHANNWNLGIYFCLNSLLYMHQWPGKATFAADLFKCAEFMSLPGQQNGLNPLHG